MKVNRNKKHSWRDHSFLVAFGLLVWVGAMGLTNDGIWAAEKNPVGGDLNETEEMRTSQPRSGAAGNDPTRTAIVIVVENNESQTYSFKKSDVFDPMKDLLHAGVGDMDLDLPKWAENVIKKSGKRLDKLVKAVHKKRAKMVNKVIGKVDKAVENESASCVKEMLEAIPQGVALGPQPGNVFLNRFGEEFYADCLRQMAEPKYDKVVVLTDKTAIFDNFKANLEELNSQGYLIDVLLDIHGCGSSENSDIRLNNAPCNEDALLFADGKKTHSDIKRINGGKPMNLNAVYMVSCWGEVFNKDWRKLGAKASNGSAELNYYVLISPLVFMDGWTSGMSLDKAAKQAYKHEKAFMNGKKYKIKMKLRNPVTGQKEKIKIGIGATWRKLIDRSLAKTHGKDKTKRVNNVKSSARVTEGDGTVRRAGL